MEAINHKLSWVLTLLMKVISETQNASEVTTWGIEPTDQNGLFLALLKLYKKSVKGKIEIPSAENLPDFYCFNLFDKNTNQIVKGIEDTIKATGYLPPILKTPLTYFWTN